MLGGTICSQNGPTISVAGEAVWGVTCLRLGYSFRVHPKFDSFFRQLGKEGLQYPAAKDAMEFVWAASAVTCVIPTNNPEVVRRVHSKPSKPAPNKTRPTTPSPGTVHGG